LNFLKPKIALIGASTGGPGLIEKIITSFEMQLDGSVILAQHMNTLSLASFAKRLNRINSVTEVIFCEEKTKIETNKIYLLNDTASLQEEHSVLYIIPNSEDKGLYHPTINRLFSSAATLRRCNIDIRAYLLSGIGADGAEGLLEIKEQGYTTIAQDEKSSIVYGMPKAAKEMNAATEILSIEEIIKDINVFMA